MAYLLKTYGPPVLVEQFIRGRELNVALIEAPTLRVLPISEVLFVEKDGGEVLAGAPFVANARIVGVVEGEARGPKIRVFKKKRRKGQRKTKGHRAVFTRVRITEIQA